MILGEFEVNGTCFLHYDLVPGRWLQPLTEKPEYSGDEIAATTAGRPNENY